MTANHFPNAYTFLTKETTIDHMQNPVKAETLALTGF